MLKVWSNALFCGDVALLVPELCARVYKNVEMTEFEHEWPLVTWHLTWPEKLLEYLRHDFLPSFKWRLPFKWRSTWARSWVKRECSNISNTPSPARLAPSMGPAELKGGCIIPRNKRLMWQRNVSSAYKPAKRKNNFTLLRSYRTKSDSVYCSIH